MNLGGMDVVSIDAATVTQVKATVRQRLVDGWGHVTIELDPNNPSLILSRTITFFEPAPAASGPRVKRTDHFLRRDIDTFAKRLTRQGIFSGVVIIARNGKPVFARAYGLARRDAGVQNATDTRFELASVSKMFTAVAIAQLVEKGRLSYSDTIIKLLPDYPNKKAAGQITVEQLVTHTSGLPDYFFSPAYAPEKFHSPRDYWPAFANDDLRSTPGSQWEYSSSNYVVLGAIIEQLTGGPFRDHIRTNVFERAGIPGVSYEGSAASNAAIGYTHFGPGHKPDLTGTARPVPTNRLGGPAGGGVASAQDLQHFMEALFDGRLVGRETARAITTEKVRAEDGGWALGFETHTWNDVRFVGHNGFFDGAFNQVDAFPMLGYTVAVLSNTDMSGGGAVANRLRILLSGSPTPTEVLARRAR